MFTYRSRLFFVASLSGRLNTIAVVSVIAATMVGIVGCDSGSRPQTTAERLKNVEIRQQTEPDSHLPRKSVDYMSGLKNIKDSKESATANTANPSTTASQSTEPPKSPLVGATLPKSAEQTITSDRPAESRASPSETRPATAAAINDAKRSESLSTDIVATTSAQNLYLASLTSYIGSIKRYPSSREARQQRPAGTVQLWVEITRDGKLKDAGIGQSSNSSILDQAALSTVKQGRYNPFPADAWTSQQSHRFTLNIEYALDANG